MTETEPSDSLRPSVQNTVSQQRRIFFAVTLFVCLFAAPMRLPAPISEINTPTPAAKAPKAPQRKISFAGTWKGSTIMRCTDGSGARADFNLVVSTDERSVDNSNAGKYSCKRNGDTLNWTNHDGIETYYSLSLKGTNSATYSVNYRTRRYTCRETGTFTR